MANENGGGGEGGGWREALPTDLKGNASLGKFQDVSALAKSYVELEGLQGASIRIPGPDAGADARKGFLEKLQAKVPELVLVPNDAQKLQEVEEHIYGRLGRPADERQYKLPSDLPHDVKLDDSVEASLRATGKGLGLTQKQFESFVKAHVAEMQETGKARRTAEASLKAKWGAAFDERIEAARAVAAKLGLSEQEVRGLDADALAVWWNVASAVAGDGGGEGARQGGGRPGTLAPSEALTRAAEIRARKEYWDPSTPQHKALVDEHMKLMKLAYPE